MRRLLAGLAVLTLVACGGDNTGPGGGGPPNYSGAFCAAGERASATSAGSTWEVTLYYNVTEREEYTDRDGFVRVRDHRLCTTVVMHEVPGATAAAAIAAARERYETTTRNPGTFNG